MGQSREPIDKNRITRLVRPDERAGNREVHTIKSRSSRPKGAATSLPARMETQTWAILTAVSSGTS